MNETLNVEWIQIVSKIMCFAIDSWQKKYIQVNIASIADTSTKANIANLKI